MQETTRVQSLMDTIRKVGELSSTSSTVDHPSHYNGNPSGIECIDVVEHMTFNLGNAIKYIWRAGRKGNMIEDLQKAVWYIAREIERLQKEKEK